MVLTSLLGGRSSLRTTGLRIHTLSPLGEIVAFMFFSFSVFSKISVFKYI